MAVGLDDPEALGILHRLDPDAARPAPQHASEIGLEDGVAEDDEHRPVVRERLGQRDRMTEPEPLGLLDELRLQRRVARADELDDALAHVPHDQDRARDAEPRQIVEDVGQDRLARDLEQHLRLGVRVRAQPGADSGDRDDGDGVLRQDELLPTS